MWKGKVGRGGERTGGERREELCSSKNSLKYALQHVDLSRSVVPGMEQMEKESV